MKHFDFSAAKRDFWLCRARLPGQLVRGGSEIAGSSCWINKIMFAVVMVMVMTMMIPHDFQGSENTSHLLVEVDGYDTNMFLLILVGRFRQNVDINIHWP